MFLGSERKKTVKIGDFYQGGIVTYVLQPTDLGYSNNQQHGLIAACEGIILPNNDHIYGEPGFYSWSTFQKNNDANYDLRFQSVNTDTSIGCGAINTENILTKWPTSMYPYSAAAVAKSYRGGGYNDWYLPSKDELFTFMIFMDYDLFPENAGIADDQDSYWSSSEADTVSAWYLWFSEESMYDIEKDTNLRVRAIRSF
jgi:hypothetical protein